MGLFEGAWCLVSWWDTGAEQKAGNERLGLCSTPSPPDGLATQSHLPFSKHHPASLPLCFAKEFIAFSASPTQPSTTISNATFSKNISWIFPGRNGLYSLWALTALCIFQRCQLCLIPFRARVIWCLPPPLCLRQGQFSSPLDHWQYLELCLGHKKWSKILVGLHFIANYISKEGW